MPKPTYQPYCGYDCRDRNDQPRLASEWVHVDGVTLFVCATCARHAFNMPAPATVRRMRERVMTQLQESLDA
jgi:hypothetical protein